MSSLSDLIADVITYGWAIQTVQYKAMFCNGCITVSLRDGSKPCEFSLEEFLETCRDEDWRPANTTADIKGGLV